MCQNVASIWLKLCKKGGKKIFIGGIYREHKLLRQALPNDTDSEIQQTNRWSQFIQQWTAANQLGDVIVIGDTNLDELKWSAPEHINLNMVNLVKMEIETQGFQQLIQGPTRFWPQQSDSLIDKCWSNCLDRVMSTSNTLNGTTDHNIIELVLRIKGKISTPTEILRRSMKNWNSENYKKEISQINWSNLYQQNNVSVAYSLFETAVLEVLNKTAPLSTVQISKKHKNWVTGATKQLMESRDQLRDTARHSQDPLDWASYRRARNLCTSSLREDRRASAKQDFEKCDREKDAGKLYKLTKARLGWDTGCSPITFLVNGNQVTAPKKLADIQQKFFIDKSRKLAEELPITNEDPHKLLRKAINDWGQKAEDRKSFKLRKVTLTETAELLRKLGNTRAFGHDTMDALSLKMAATSLLAPINFLINLSISTQNFPSQWKIGKIVPIFKGKGLSRVTPESYRPISLLPVTSKIVERAIQQQLVEFMCETGQWNLNHHAYRKNHSTTTAILQLLDQLYEATDDNLITTLMTVDESNAFESVNHDLLLEKMVLYKFEPTTVEWFRNYLGYRSSYVTISAKNSNMVATHQGVPQGSVLGPLLYTLFINELPELVKEDDCSKQNHSEETTLFGLNCEPCGAAPCYADDTSVIHASDSRISNQTSLESHLDRTVSFLNANRLNLNKGKTTICEIMTRQKRARAVGLPPALRVLDKFGNFKHIGESNYTQILGCNISKDLDWSAHLVTGEKALLPKLRKQLGALKLLSKELPKRSRLLLVNGLLLSKICYMIQAWGGARDNLINKVQVVLNQSARFVTGLGKRTRTMKLMESCNWLSIKELIAYQSLISLWRIIHLNIPEQINDHIAISDDFSLCTRPARLLLVKKGFRHRTICVWNLLPEDVRMNKKISIFKKQVRLWIIGRRQNDPG